MVKSLDEVSISLSANAPMNSRASLQMKPCLSKVAQTFLSAVVQGDRHGMTRLVHLKGRTGFPTR